MVRGGGTSDVELVEDVPDEPPGARPSRRRRVRPWALAVVAVLVVAGLVGAQAVVDARERARLERVLDVQGAVAPLPDALRVRWSLDPRMVPVAGAQDPRTVVAVRRDRDGAQEVVALDAAGGDVRWREPLLPAPGERGGTAEPVGTRCAAPDRDRVVCLASDAYLVSEGTSSFTTTTTTARLLVLDAETGDVLAEHAARRGDVHAHALALAGDAAVLLGADELRRSHVWAVDPATGRERWGTTLPEGTTGTDPGALGPAGLDDVVTLRDGAVAVLVRDGAVVLLDPADGRVLRTPAPGTAPADVTPLPDGRADVAVPDGEDAVVLRADGDVRVRGRLLPVTQDDGSLAGVLLAQGGGRVRAVDAATGDVRWESTAALVDAAAVLDGRVHLVSTSRLTTLDAATGAALWQRERTGVFFTGVVTDGALLYEPRPVGATGRGELVGVDPADGTERRTVALPPDARSVRPWARVLVASSGDRLDVLG